MLIPKAFHKHNFFQLFGCRPEADVRRSGTVPELEKTNPVWRLLPTCHTSSYVHLSMLHLDSNTETTANLL